MVKVYVKDTEKIKTEVYKRGITLKQFAADCSISFNYFSAVINGHKAIGAANAKKIADALDVKMDELFDFRVPVK